MTKETFRRANNASSRLSKAETNATARLNNLMGKNFDKLQKAVRRNWGEYQNLNQLPNQKAIALSKVLGEYLDPSPNSEKVFRELYERSQLEGASLAKDLLQQVGVTIKEARTNDLVDFWTSDSVGRLGDWGQAFKRDARAIFELGMSQGWSDNQVIDALTSRFGQLQFQAQRIVRTGSVATMNSTATAYYKKAGIELYQWIATLDDRLCFPASTLIETDSGQIPIKDIRVGDRVLTRFGYRNVVNTMVRDYRGEMIRIKAANSVVECTPDHPFWTTDGWIEAQKLKHGDTVQTFNKQLIKINSIDYFFLFKSKNCPPMFSQISIFLNIFSFVLMPVFAISFYAQPKFWKGKINRITPKLIFLYKIKVKSFHRLSNKFFQRCFSNIFPITRDVTKSSISSNSGNNPEVLGTCFTFDNRRRSSTFFRAIISIDAFCLLRKLPKYCFPASQTWLSNRSFVDFSALERTNVDLVFSFSRLWKIKDLIANNTFFCNASFSKSTFFPTVASTVNTGFSPKLKKLSTVFTKSKLCRTRGSKFVATDMTAILSSFQTSLKNFLAHHTIFSDRHGYKEWYRCNYSITNKVYNLTVEEHPEYFADGLLVHNCNYCSTRNSNVYYLKDMAIPAHNHCRCIAVPVRRRDLLYDKIDREYWRQQKAEGLEQLRQAGGQANTGVSPFEKRAGASNSPNPVWQPDKGYSYGEKSKTRRVVDE